MVLWNKMSKEEQELIDKTFGEVSKFISSKKEKLENELESKWLWKNISLFVVLDVKDDDLWKD